MQIIADCFLSILVMLAPLIFFDLFFFNGKFTRRFFKLMGDFIENAIMLVFQGIGAALRGLWRGIWHGIRGNQKIPNQRNQNQRIEHHHYIHHEDE